MIDPADKNIEYDTSVRKLAVLPDGRTAVIQGAGIEVPNADHIDVTDLPEREFTRLNKNVGSMQVDRKGDKITIRTRRGKPIVMQDKQHGSADN